MNNSDYLALRLLKQLLEEWKQLNVRALAAGGSKVQGDLEATGMLYSEACGYIRALDDVIEKGCKEVDEKLRAHS